MKKDVLEALEIILENIQPKPSGKVYINDSLSRVTAKDIICKQNYPPINKTAMDGYAVVHKNIDKPLKEIYNIEDIEENSALRINTGNEIPSFADCVVEIELTKKENGYIRVLKQVEQYRNFIFKGSELKKGDIVIKKGELIDYSRRAMLAYLGEVLIDVYQKPIIGIITTGDEVRMPGEQMKGMLVYNTNYFYLEGFINNLNSQCTYFGHVNDDLKLLSEAFSYAVDRCDLIVSTGGASKGTKDFTKKVLKMLNAEILFDETTVKPGKPLILGKIKDKTLFGMPGWPASLATNCQVFLKPAIKKLSGLTNYKNEILYAETTKPMHSRKEKDYFNRSLLHYSKNSSFIEPQANQETSNFHSMVKANCLAWLGKEKGDVEKGEILPVLLID